MTYSNRRLLWIVGSVTALLLANFVAMQFTEEVNWSFFDFVIAAVLLYGTGLLCELVLRKVTKTSHRIGLGLAILFVLALAWAEMAVGIFGSPIAGS